MFNIYDTQNGRYIKESCKFMALIPAGMPLTDDMVREYFGIDESHNLWNFNHKPFRVDRYVFDKCVIPKSKSFRIELAEEVN